MNPIHSLVRSIRRPVVSTVRGRATGPVAALTLVAFATAITAGGCASEYTIVDRSALVVSDNARTSAASVLPGGATKAAAANHLALAQEVYQKQLDLLKERRNKVRARRRSLNLLSYGVLAAASIGAGAIALSASSPDTQRAGGIAALSGVALGTGFQIGGLMQEDAANVDDKIRYLQSLYESMVDRVRVLASQPQSDAGDAAIGAAIEAFVNEALRINVKG
ncbi:MAG TPA: hypothetical protein VHU40_02250 [Polyangia bacterium]|jgi:hypothetical protein|nr:hypothetical protein [Polyangia bacterium]